MASSLEKVRPLAAACIGIGSVLAGLVLAFRLVTPGVVDRLPTNELLGLLGLLVLPLLALWALWADRHAASRAASLAPEPFCTAQFIEAKPVANDAASEPEIEVHPAGRRAVRHHRLDPSRSPV